MKALETLNALITVTCLGMAANTFAAGERTDLLLGDARGYLVTYDGRDQILTVHGDKNDNFIEVAYDSSGRILVNNEPVVFSELCLTAKNTVGIMIHGGAGNDILIGENVRDVAINGGEGEDVVVLITSQERNADGVPDIDWEESASEFETMGWDNVKNVKWTDAASAGTMGCGVLGSALAFAL